MGYGKKSHQWLDEYHYDKERVAHPDHRVFIAVGGTDCDGFRWSQYYSFRFLKEALETIDETLAWADGPTSYCTLSRDDWEQAGYPEYRDRYAEAMGY